MDDRVMASPDTIWTYAIVGIIFVIAGVVKLCIGSGGYSMCVIGIFCLIHVFRISRHPVVSFEYANHLTLLTIFPFPARLISINKIKEIKEGRWFATKLVLVDGESIPLPLNLLKRVDREGLLNKIKTLMVESNQTEQ